MFSSIQLCFGILAWAALHSAFRQLLCDHVWRLLCNAAFGHRGHLWNHQRGLGLRNRSVTCWFLFSSSLSLADALLFSSHRFFHPCSFMDDIEVMLKWRPPVIYKYLWKYVCLLAMIGLLAASLLRMVFKGPTYTAWNQDKVRCQSLMFQLNNSTVASSMTLWRLEDMRINLMQYVVIAKEVQDWKYLLTK